MGGRIEFQKRGQRLGRKLDSNPSFGHAPTSRPFSESFLKVLRTSLLSFRRTSGSPKTTTLSALRKTTINTLTETTDLVHRHSVVSEKFSNFLRTSAGNSVRYEAVNAMLLNEFLKAHRRIEEQDATIMRLQKQIDAVTAGLKKVSAQLEVSKPAEQTVLNNQ
jgi:hypothetical protein